jgi:hypothetical protein
MTITPAARRAAAAVALLALVPTGCGSSPGSVTGTVTLNGNPVGSVSVSFVAGDGTIRSGFTAADGTYRVEEVPTGPVQVTVQGTEVVTETVQQDLKKRGGAPAPKKTTKSPVPARYGDSSTSGLSLTVKSGDNNKYDIPLMP